MISLEREETRQGSKGSLRRHNVHHSGHSVAGLEKIHGKINGNASRDVAKPSKPLGKEYHEPLKELQNKPAYLYDHNSRAMFHPNFQKVQRSLVNAFESPFYPFQCAPFNVFPQFQLYELQLQEFQYFVVIDFEATCDKERNPHPQEIIEFPSVIVNSVTGQLESCFQTYVRPTYNQQLSDFCKDLTGIQQTQVDRGVTLSEALHSHDDWLQKKGIKNAKFAVVTWSNWDCRVMLESECRFKKIQKPSYFNQWINLKVPFREVFGNQSCNLKEAVEMAGLTWHGRAHCGLDDAKNTACLLALLMRLGFRFSITNTLLWASADQPMTQNPYTKSFPFSPYYPHKLSEPATPVQELTHYCFCGVQSIKGTVRKPGPKQGSCFFGCGNWTAARGAHCQYFEWASP